MTSYTCKYKWGIGTLSQEYIHRIRIREPGSELNFSLPTPISQLIRTAEYSPLAYLFPEAFFFKISTSPTLANPYFYVKTSAKKVKCRFFKFAANCYTREINEVTVRNSSVVSGALTRAPWGPGCFWSSNFIRQKCTKAMHISKNSNLIMSILVPAMYGTKINLIKIYK